MSEYTEVLKNSLLNIVESIITDRDTLDYYASSKSELIVEVIIDLYDPIEYGRKYLEGLLEVYTVHPNIDPANVCVQTLITNALSYFLSKYSFVKAIILSTK